MSIQDEALWEVMEIDATHRFFIQWDNEQVAEKPAIIICRPNSIGSIELANSRTKRRGWTVWFHLIAHWEFTRESDALQKVKEIFLSGKEKHGKLLHNTRVGKVFVSK